MSGGSSKHDQPTGPAPMALDSDLFSVKVALGDEKFTWELSTGFDLKPYLDSVNGSALQWTNEKGNTERIVTSARLLQAVGKYPDRVFTVIPKISVAPAPAAAPAADPIALLVKLYLEAEANNPDPVAEAYLDAERRSAQGFATPFRLNLSIPCSP